MSKDKFGLESLAKGVSSKAGQFLDDIQKELAQEEEDAIKDFIKGAYRLIVEKEREAKELAAQIETIRDAINDATAGKWDKLGDLKIPARFFSEEMLRKHGKSLLQGNAEIRMMELYVPESEE